MWLRVGILISLRLMVAASLASIVMPATAYAGQLPGKPIARALPEYCQMGECTIITIEYSDPILFHSKGVLFRVGSQNWYRTFNTKKPSRGADTVSYVFCSKQLPAVIDETAVGKFLVTFLTPNDAGTHGHANSISLEMYFAVCHGRFLVVPIDDIAGFANALSYNAKIAEAQPTIDKPERIVEFLNEK